MVTATGTSTAVAVAPPRHPPPHPPPPPPLPAPAQGYSNDNSQHYIAEDCSERSLLSRAIAELSAQVRSASLEGQASRASLTRAIETLTASLAASGANCTSLASGEVANQCNGAPFASPHAASSVPLPGQLDKRERDQTCVDMAGVVLLDTAAKGNGHREPRQSLGAAHTESTWVAEHSSSGSTLCEYRTHTPGRSSISPKTRWMSVADHTLHSSMGEALLANLPRYDPYTMFAGDDVEVTQWLPKIETAVKVYRVSDVDTASMTFQADFTVHLDWEDPNLEDFEGNLKELDWDNMYFNPKVSIHNAKESEDGWLDGGDDIPRWNPPQATLGMPRCLRKTKRFKGVLCMNCVDLHNFPIDVQRLPIVVKGIPCRNLDHVIHSAVGKKVSRDAFKFYMDDSTRTKNDSAYKKSKWKSCGNYLQLGADVMAEFRLCGATGSPGQEEYTFNLFVERPLMGSYTWSIITMNMLLICCAASFWDVAAPDVSSRMSITLTVILAIAVTGRPHAIETTTYVTLYDKVSHLCLAVATFISLANVWIVTICGGHHEEATPFQREVFRENSSLCERDWCGSTRIDCDSFFATFIIWAGGMACITYYALRQRRGVTGKTTGTPSLERRADKFLERGAGNGISMRRITQAIGGTSTSGLIQ